METPWMAPPDITPLDGPLGGIPWMEPHDLDRTLLSGWNNTLDGNSPECKNFTLPQTSFAGGNNGHLS